MYCPATTPDAARRVCIFPRLSRVRLHVGKERNEGGNGRNSSEKQASIATTCTRQPLHTTWGTTTESPECRPRELQVKVCGCCCRRKRSCPRAARLKWCRGRRESNVQRVSTDVCHGSFVFLALVVANCRTFQQDALENLHTRCSGVLVHSPRRSLCTSCW
jgi:hypothetical protein